MQVLDFGERTVEPNVRQKKLEWRKDLSRFKFTFEL